MPLVMTAKTRLALLLGYDDFLAASACLRINYARA
jgi:hypothetical protein